MRWPVSGDWQAWTEARWGDERRKGYYKVAEEVERQEDR